MDPLVKSALVGTAQGGDAGPASGPTDALVEAALAGESDARERALLLRAGAASIYRVAGARPQGAAPTPLPCPPETLRPCSSAMTEILRAMLSGDQRDLLPLALVEMRGNKLALPAELLPTALACPEDQRPFILPLLGSRGRWLAAHNPEWSWALRESLGADDPPPADADRIFEEGELSERRRVLRLLRRSDPGRARALLEAAWKSEKAEVRRSFIAILAIGLGEEDEPFLEAALGDRALAVRGRAAELLSRLPGSALAQRMIARADAILSLEAASVGARLKAAVRGEAALGKLGVALPDDFDPSWAKDGVIEAPPGGVGRKAWWLSQILAATPIAHWEARFEADPAAIVGLVRGHGFAGALLDGLTAAALRQGAKAWMGPLWDLWRTIGKGGPLVPQPLSALIAEMDAESAEARVSELLEVGTLILEILSALPTPWTDKVALAYLRGLHDRLSGLGKRRPQSDDPWLESLRTAGRALPSGRMPEALALPAPPAPAEASNWYLDRWRGNFRLFTEALALRQRLAQEMRS